MDLNALFQSSMFNNIDRAFGRMIDRILGAKEPLVALAAGLVSRAAANGDVCLDLEEIAEQGFQTTDAGFRIPEGIAFDQWYLALAASAVVGEPGSKKPMILDGKRIYLQRYWNYETTVAEAIRGRSRTRDGQNKQLNGEDIAAQLFGDEDPDQSRAVQAALRHRFTVISGGPGTGKTTTIAKMIFLFHRSAADKPPKIVLAAPTGKAAARMQEALDRGLDTLQQRKKLTLPNEFPEAQTLHRLLGAIPGKPLCRFNRHHPLPVDVVIVDEASMIDLALMAKLMQALPDAARIILVGDKDQLASVEAGSVLGDICAGLTARKVKASGPENKSDDGGGLVSHIVVLRKSYRFSAQSGIDELGQAINAGNGPMAMALLEDAHKSHVTFRTMPSPQALEKELSALVHESLGPVFKTEDPRAMLERMNAFKILCPVRKGPSGVTALNQIVERILKRFGLIHMLPGGEVQWYPGRPVMINRNDYHLNLFNGDVGIAVVEDDGQDRSLRVAFPDGGSAIHTLAPEQLPAHETVYAMTVHKSQGTEFDRILLVLPDQDVPVLTRELIYTAVTRARKQVEIWGRPEIFLAAVKRRIRRASGLREALWREA